MMRSWNWLDFILNNLKIQLKLRIFGSPTTTITYVLFVKVSIKAENWILRISVLEKFAPSRLKPKSIQFLCKKQQFVQFYNLKNPTCSSTWTAWQCCWLFRTDAHPCAVFGDSAKWPERWPFRTTTPRRRRSNQQTASNSTPVVPRSEWACRQYLTRPWQNIELMGGFIILQIMKTCVIPIYLSMPHK